MPEIAEAEALLAALAEADEVKVEAARRQMVADAPPAGVGGKKDVAEAPNAGDRAAMPASPSRGSGKRYFAD